MSAPGAPGAPAALDVARPSDSWGTSWTVRLLPGGHLITGLAPGGPREHDAMRAAERVLGEHRPPGEG
jgi:hypothetical protein